MAELTGKLVTVGNLKGGVGKSTVTVNLAAIMAARKQRVCIIDCDPQLTSANWLIGGSFGIHVIAMPLTEVTHAKLWIAHVRQLISQFDLVIIDLPAVLGPALASAMLVSHLVMVPMSLGGIDLHGTQRMVHFIQATAAERQGAAPSVLLVPTRVSPAIHGTAAVRERLERFGQPVAQGLRDHPAFADAFEAHRWVGQLEGAADCRADVEQLAMEVDQSLATAAMAPVLVQQMSLLARITGQQLPIGNLGDNHKEGLVWWRRLISGG